MISDLDSFLGSLEANGASIAQALGSRTVDPRAFVTFEKRDEMTYRDCVVDSCVVFNCCALRVLSAVSEFIFVARLS